MNTTVAILVLELTFYTCFVNCSDSWQGSGCYAPFNRACSLSKTCCDSLGVSFFYMTALSRLALCDTCVWFFQGYVVRISGGNDKQGFPMKQGVLTTGRVRLLLSAGHSCYRPRRDGERRRKSVRGCIVDANLSVLNLVIVRKGVLLIVSLCVNRQ